MASVLACGLLAGCNGGVEYEPEENATLSYLYVDTAPGGFGSEYLSVVAKAFESANADKSYAEGKMGVKIEVGESATNNDEKFKLGVGSSPSDVHVVEGLYYTDLLSDNSILELTDIVTKDTLADGKTIESKLNTEQQKVLKYNGKYYTIPTFAGYTGLTYNADLFKNNNLFFADSTESPDATSSYTGKAYTGRPLVRNQNAKKSPGPDGLYKTDDDGLPSSYEEFFYLYDFMLDSSPSITPMILYGGHYANYIFQELLCAASTANGLNSMFSFNSNGEEIEVISGWNPDDTPQTKWVVITEENGYESTMQVSRYMATKFMKHLSTNKVNNKSYLHASSLAGLSNTNAQKLFMESSLDPSLTPIATLAEGVYWYNESAGTREGMAGTYGEDVENMNLKYMPLPAKEYGTITENNGTTQLVADSLQYYLVINAKVANNKEKLDLATDFVKFMYSDEMLQKMTTTSGIPFALKYDLTDTQYQSMNTLSQSFWNVYKGAKDKDAYITGLSLSPTFLANTERFSFKSTNNAFKSKVNGAETTDALTYFFNNKNVSAKEFFTGMSIDVAGWANYKR